MVALSVLFVTRYTISIQACIPLCSQPPPGGSLVYFLGP